MDTMKEIGKHKNIINLIGACTQNGRQNVLKTYVNSGWLINSTCEGQVSLYCRAVIIFLLLRDIAFDFSVNYFQKASPVDSYSNSCFKFCKTKLKNISV